MISRRTFLRRAGQLGLGLTVLGGAGVGYGFWEASQIGIDRQTIAVPNLPTSFAGKTIAVLADLHHGPFVGIEFIRQAVAMANALNPDVVALVGDYAHKGSQADIQLGPCLEALSELKAPLGVYAVPGNHDMQHQGRSYREAIARTPLIDLTNRSVTVAYDGECICLVGVDDLWWGRPNLRAALARTAIGSAVILLCHNPDFMEEAPDPRVGLALCGHMHGGQVCLPSLHGYYVPSRYGTKYLHGMVQGPASQVYVSRGLGEAGIPLRINAPPEINLITLATPGA